MLKNLRSRLTYANVMSTIACFGVLAGGTAYAANTIGSADIIDESIVSADIKNYGVKRSDIGLNSINSARIEDGAVTGPDIGANAVNSGHVLNNSLDGGHLADGSVTGDDIDNFTLNDEDVGQATFVNFAANIGTVPAHTCVYKHITGLQAHGDHLLLTPSADSSRQDMTYTIQYTYTQGEGAWIHACNTSSLAIADGTTEFNLLVIDAQ